MDISQNSRQSLKGRRKKRASALINYPKTPVSLKGEIWVSVVEVISKLSTLIIDGWAFKT